MAGPGGGPPGPANRNPTAIALVALLAAALTLGFWPRRPASDRTPGIASHPIAGGLVTRLLISTPGRPGAVVLADPIATRRIAGALRRVAACPWHGEGSYHLEFRLDGGESVWLGYDPADQGYLARLGQSGQAWRPSAEFHALLRPYLPPSTQS